MAESKTKIVITAEDRTKAAFTSVNRQMIGLVDGANHLGKAFGAALGALSFAGLAAVAKNSIDAADALSDMSQRTGVAVRTLAEYQRAATLADTSLDDLAKGIQRLTLSQGQAEQGGKAQAAALLRLGISAKDPKIAFEQLADAVAKSNDPTRLAVDLNALLGRSYVNLLPLLQGGSKGLRESAAASDSFADAMVRLAPEASRFNDQLDELKLNAAGASAQLLTKLVPGLNETTEAVGRLLDEDKGIQALVRAVAGLGKIPFDILIGNPFKDADTAAGRIKELNRELAFLDRRLKLKAVGYVLPGLFVKSLSELEREILVRKNQIEALQKFGDDIFKKKEKAERETTEDNDLDLSDPEASKKAAARAAAAKTAARAAAAAARQEAVALARAQEVLEKARLDAAAQGLEGGIAARHEKLDQARKAELIDEAGFIAAKAALDEEGLRNELTALQAQRDKLRAQSTDRGSKASERTLALAELTLVEARIVSASDKILNLNRAATAELTALGVAKLRAQSEFIDGLEQEAFLSGSNNEERETALLLLEAEKLGIQDVNRLLELQGQIRANANAKQAAEELKRQQDDLYESVQDGVQRAFADGLNAIATGEAGFRSALKNIVDTIRNAMSNALAGSLADGFLGLLGGKGGVLNIAGSLGLGAKKDGSSPGSAIYVRDVSAGGIAGAGTGDGGGLLSTLGDMLSGLFNGIRAALSGLMSSIGNALSGLFSSGGGSSGSSAGSWISAIASIFGYAEGGFTGPGSKYQPAGVVHAGEYVFSADSVRRLGLSALDNLHRMAKGSMVPTMPRFGYAEGGAVNLPGAAAPNVSVRLRNINHIDLDSAMSDYMNSRAGERAILNVIQRNPKAV